MAHSQKIIKARQNILKQFLTLRKPDSSPHVCPLFDWDKQLDSMNLGLNQYLIPTDFSMIKKYACPLDVCGIEDINWLMQPANYTNLLF